MTWGNEPDFEEERRKFRNRWQNDEDVFSAADAEDLADDGSSNDMSLGEHAAGLDRDLNYDGQYNPYNPVVSPPQQYPPQTPQYGQAPPPQQYPPVPPQYGQAPPPQQYPPVPPQYGQAPPPQQYPPVPPQYGQAPPPQYPPAAPQYPPQYEPAPSPLPDRAQRFQERLNHVSAPASSPTSSDSADGIDGLMRGKLNIPNPMMIGIVLLLMATMVCVMGILALGSLDRHLGLGIF